MNRPATGNGRGVGGRWRRVRRRIALGVGRAMAIDGPRWPFAIPVVYGAGIAAYFAAAREPAAWIAPTVVIAASAGLLWAHRRRRPVAAAAAILLASLALGHAVADARTAMQVGPILGASTGIVALEGRVVAVERLADGRPRVTLAPPPDFLAPRATPDRVRIRLLPDAEPPRVGDRIALRGGLLPPRGPVLPGGFDFRRHLAFQGIGAVGFAVSPWTPQPAAPGDPRPGWIAGAAAVLADWRGVIADRIDAAIADPAAAAVATALLTGDRAAIPESVSVALRDAGIAHLLAISGLHVGLVAGLAFVTLRAIGAAIPRIALTWPIKKLAAAAALAAAVAYMFLVGAPVPTQRAVLMGGLVLLAVLVDRRALTLRLVAIAAMAVMTVNPASVPGPSFQMSFAAVLALVAGWQALAPRLAPERDRPPGVGGRAVGYAVGLVGTSVLASAATGLFALYHFQRIAAAGVVANLWAVPLTAFAIMPAGTVGVLLIPLGWDAPVFAAMGAAIGLLIDSAAWVAGWQGAALSVPSMPVWGLLTGTVGGLWLLLAQAPWRWFGTLGLALATVSPALTDRPIILVEGEGRLLAVATRTALLPSDPRAAGFVQAQWERALARPAGPSWAEIATGRAPMAPAAWERAVGMMPNEAEPDFRDGSRRAEDPGDIALACDAVGCVARVAGVRIALPTDRSAYREDCARADILIAAGVVPPGLCTNVAVLDRSVVLAGEGGALMPPAGGGWAAFRSVFQGRRDGSNLAGLGPYIRGGIVAEGDATPVDGARNGRAAGSPDRAGTPGSASRAGAPLAGWRWVPVRPPGSSRPWHPGFEE